MKTRKIVNVKSKNRERDAFSRSPTNPSSAPWIGGWKSFGEINSGRKKFLSDQMKINNGRNGSVEINLEK